MALIKLAEKRWTYILYKSDDSYILSVVCGGVGLFELNIPLSNEDGKKAFEDKLFLEKIAAEIANDPKKYSSQSISIEEL
jgi:hypothetical protein